MTAADKYADELYEMSRHITSTPESITLMRSRDELRRLAPMEMELAGTKAASIARQTDLMAKNEASKARVKELEDALRLALPYLRNTDDCGPEGEGWKSDELMALITKTECLLGETK